MSASETTTQPLQILQKARDWQREGHGVALATVVKTWGSSPRPVGSQLVVNDDGAFEGSVSGGCIEGAVVREALEIIAQIQDIGQAAPRLLDFGVTDEQAWDVGLACGGNVKVHVTPCPRDDELDLLLTQTNLARVTRIADGARAFVNAEHPQADEFALTADITAAVTRAITDDRSALIEGEDGDLFAHVFNPPLRMIIIGAVHISQALAPMAQLAGFSVTIVDPRRAFATNERFPGITLNTEWPDDALAELKPDNRTAVVTLVHDPKIDDPALEVALRSDAFYIASLGSRRTHAKRLERFGENGFDAANLARIHGPGGLAIGAKSPAEIAVSILAEAVAAKYGKSPRQPK